MKLILGIVMALACVVSISTGCARGWKSKQPETRVKRPEFSQHWIPITPGYAQIYVTPCSQRSPNPSWIPFSGPIKGNPEAYMVIGKQQLPTVVCMIDQGRFSSLQQMSDYVGTNDAPVGEPLLVCLQQGGVPGIDTLEDIVFSKNGIDLVVFDIGYNPGDEYCSVKPLSELERESLSALCRGPSNINVRICSSGYASGLSMTNRFLHTETRLTNMTIDNVTFDDVLVLRIRGASVDSLHAYARGIGCIARFHISEELPHTIEMTRPSAAFSEAVDFRRLVYFRMPSRTQGVEWVNERWLSKDKENRIHFRFEAL